MSKKKIPTVTVFVRGGLVQDVASDGLVRVIVLDFDTSDDDQDDSSGVFIDPTDKSASIAWVQDHNLPASSADAAYVRAAELTADLAWL